MLKVVILLEEHVVVMEPKAGSLPLVPLKHVTVGGPTTEYPGLQENVTIAVTS